MEALLGYAGKQILDNTVFRQPNAAEPMLSTFAPAMKILKKNKKCLKYDFSQNEPKSLLAPKELIVCGLEENDHNHMFTNSHLGLLNNYHKVLGYVEAKNYDFENAETVSQIKNPENENEFFVGNKTITIEVKKREN